MHSVLMGPEACARSRLRKPDSNSAGVIVCFTYHGEPRKTQEIGPLRGGYDKAWGSGYAAKRRSAMKNGSKVWAVFGMIAVVTTGAAAGATRTDQPKRRRVAWSPHARRASFPAKPPCLRESVPVERGFGGAMERLTLTRCDGGPAFQAVERLSILAQPRAAPRPKATTPARVSAVDRSLGSGVRVKLISEGLVVRLQAVVDHFHARKVTIVSGYRPNSTGSFHQAARALDLHLDGVPNERLAAFCRTLADTGCGYYPNSSFVHLDVRPPHSGHVYWIDASGPGERAQYVVSWPPGDPSSGAADAPRAFAIGPGDGHIDGHSMKRLPFSSDSRVDASGPRATSQFDEDPFAP
jgi:hypothetical protein